MSQRLADQLISSPGVRLLRLFLFAVASMFLLVYLFVASRRLVYPFALEWIEGGLWQAVQHLKREGVLYTAPRLDYVPFIYPPLYFYLSAWVSQLLGNDGFLPLRLVSFLASLVILGGVFLLVYRQTADVWAGWVSMGLFVATYHISGDWLDLGRVDSLFLALWVLFLLSVAASPGRALTALLAGCWLALLLLSKQTGILLVLPSLGWLTSRDRRALLWLLSSALFLFGVVSLVLEIQSRGWYSFYVFGMLSNQTEWSLRRFIFFWLDDWIVAMPIATLLMVFFFAFSAREKGFWLSLLSGGVLAALLSRAKVGGYLNVLLPLYIAIACIFGLG